MTIRIHIIAIMLLLLLPVTAASHADHEAAEAEGMMIWEKLSAKQTECQYLSEEDFSLMGEFFMGRMMGEQHEAMESMMEEQMGEEGEEQAHVVLGKRLSGCDPAAAYPTQWDSRMTRMMPFGTMLGNGNFGMHSGYSWFWGILTFLWLTIIILLIILLVRRVSAQTAGKKSTPALDILKERYAKGEIGQEEFEQKKRGLAA